MYYLDKQRVLNFLSWYDGSVIDNIKKANELFINKLNLNTSKRISLKSIDSRRLIKFRNTKSQKNL